MNKVQAHIHSLDGKFAEVTILQYNNERLIMQRNEQRGKTANAIKERRKENPDYARPEREFRKNKTKRLTKAKENDIIDI